MKPRSLMPLIAIALLASTLPLWSADTKFVPPITPRITYNFNADWKFIRQDVPGAEVVAFDDSQWQTVSTPHTFNDIDSFRSIIDHSLGDHGKFTGVVWYRKHFKLPAADFGTSRVFLEFEGMRQAGDIYLNGLPFGLYENGVTAYGLDITSGLHFGDQDNVIAVRIDNRESQKYQSGPAAQNLSYKERATGVAFRWNANDFNPDFGGINRRVWLHVTGIIYQTLPLYYGLGTTGTYIYCTDYNISGHSCTVNIESQVHNATTNRQVPSTNVTLSAVVVDKDGIVRATYTGKGVDMLAGAKTVLTASGALTGARFWSPDEPYLYDVYTMLTVDGKVIDVTKTTTGFRKVEFKGGAGTGGVYINDKFVYLKGYAERSADEWAAVGVGYPEWMHDFTAQMIRDDNGNYMRWMHVTPQKVDVESYDRFGIVEIAPAADKEEDAQGRQWDQRVEVMRDSIIYLRNSPSILMWEAGNTGVTGPQMQEMVALRKQYDPNGGRFMGCRSLNQPEAVAAAEWSGTMLGGPYNDKVRDREPLIETEDFRDEGARRYWDDFSPPYYGFKKGPSDTWNYNSESFAVAQVKRYWNFYSNRISNTDPAHAKFAAYASIYFTDEDADGRQDSSEVARVSGKVDAMRLPKEAYYVEQVMQNEKPDIHILGHWSYPATQPSGSPTVKTMYVVANNVDSVELFVNGKSMGKMTTPDSGYLYTYPNIAFVPGTIKAVGYKGTTAVANYTLTTAGAPAAIKLTLHTAPGGMRADGEDIALIDFEVVDAKGNRCPTDDARVDFAWSSPGGTAPATAPATWLGGYNSGKINSTYNLYLNTEDGINRVALRSTRTPGSIKVTATREGLKPATVSFDTKPVQVTDGLSQEEQVTLSPSAAK